MTYTLLIWEVVPERTEIYLIPSDVAKQYQRFLEEAHSRYINYDDLSEGLSFLNTALSEKYAEGGFEEHLGKFVPYKVDTSAPLTGTHITDVIISGFAL